MHDLRTHWQWYYQPSRQSCLVHVLTRHDSDNAALLWLVFQVISYFDGLLLGLSTRSSRCKDNSCRTCNQLSSILRIPSALHWILNAIVICRMLGLEQNVQVDVLNRSYTVMHPQRHHPLLWYSSQFSLGQTSIKDRFLSMKFFIRHLHHRLHFRRSFYI